jgi:hypothetical protein
MFLSNGHWKINTIYITMTPMPAVMHAAPAMLRPQSHKRTAASTGVTTLQGKVLLFETS